MVTHRISLWVVLAVSAIILLAAATRADDDKDRERRVRVALALSGEPLPRAPMPRAKGVALAAPIDWLIRGPEAEPVAAPKPYTPDLPAGAVRYPAARYTQSISVLFDGRDHDVIEAVPIPRLPDTRWHQPGGLEGIDGWKTEKFRTLPKGGAVAEKIASVPVKNSYGVYQQNRALTRSYPDGTRFDELLTNADSGRVFEHRVRVKAGGKWESYVEFKDEIARPKGYTGLKVSCASCHNEAGTGGYAVGLVPGGDTVLSDPLPWPLWQRRSPETGEYKRTESKLFDPKK